MFSKTQINEMNCNRKLEKNLKQFSNVMLINSQNYMNTILSAIELCDRCQLKRQTKYLVKKSLDTYKLINNDCDQIELQFAAINLFRMALKFNEDPQIYDQVTIQDCMIHCDPRYIYQDFIDFQIIYLQLEIFKMDFTTPQDYLGTFSKIFKMTQQQKNLMYVVMELALLIPQLICCYAEEIFYGAMLIVFEGKVPKEWILNQCYYKDNLQQIKDVIEYYYLMQVKAAQSNNAQFQ